MLTAALGAGGSPHQPTDCTASLCKGTPAAAATCAISAMGCAAPISLFADITEIRASSPPRSATSASTAATCTRPFSSTGSSTTSKPGDVAAVPIGVSLLVAAATVCAPLPAVGFSAAAPAKAIAASSTAWCSTAEMATNRRRGSSVARAAAIPLMAMLSAVVPPEVKMMSSGAIPRSSASVSRASSSTRRAWRPVVCRLEALPAGALR